jgi:hypothetical protein
LINHLSQILHPYFKHVIFVYKNYCYDNQTDISKNN